MVVESTYENYHHMLKGSKSNNTKKATKGVLFHLICLHFYALKLVLFIAHPLRKQLMSLFCILRELLHVLLNEKFSLIYY